MQIGVLVRSPTVTLLLHKISSDDLFLVRWDTVLTSLRYGVEITCLSEF